jgi:hypothetical protein
MQDWLVIPYKKPDKDLRENRVFNYHLSRVRIASEHTIGLLKGRLQSLRQLRLKIKSAQDLKFANLWIHACIVIHSFCMEHETVSENQDFLDLGLDVERVSQSAQVAEDEANDNDEGEAQEEEEEPQEEEPGEEEEEEEETRNAGLCRAKIFREMVKGQLLYHIVQ